MCDLCELAREASSFTGDEDLYAPLENSEQGEGGAGEQPVAAGTAGAGATGDQRIDGLLSGIKWNADTLTFSFPTKASHYGYSGEKSTFGELSNNAKNAVRDIMDMYGAVADIEFQEITETNSTHADIRFADSDSPSTAWAYYPSSGEWGGDIWSHKSGTYGNYYNNPVSGNYGYATFVHEVGHALGLKHGHETGGNGALPFATDSMEYSIMTYRSYVGASTGGGYTNETWGYAQTPMQYDIAALQAMYGANYNTNSGNTVYSWSETTGEMFVNGAGQGAPGGNVIFRTVWDGGGEDTYDLSNYSNGVVINLEPGGWTTTTNTQLARLHWSGSQVAEGNIANALLFEGDKRSLIENAIGGAGNDTIIGNEAGNELIGGAGQDLLMGQAGDDNLVGGFNKDKIFGGEGNDVIKGSQGKDQLRGGADNDSIFGGNGNDLILGDKGNDVLKGNRGNDILIGGKGADILMGGGGSDVFVFKNGDGSDSIVNFEENFDKIDFSGNHKVSSINDLKISQSGKNTLIEYESGKITILDINGNVLDVEDFIFA